jgi:hypothetical protein
MVCRAAFDARNSFEQEVVIGVAVAAQDCLGVVSLEQVQHNIPVRDAVIDGVMGDENNRLILGQLFQSLIEPAHILWCPVAVAHLHQRPLVHADEAESALLEYKAVLLPDSREIRRARLRPFGVVIARDDVAGDFDAIEDFLGQGELLARTVFCDIAGYHDEAQAGEGIDVVNRGTQVLLAVG